MTIKFEGISETTEPFTLEPGTYVLEYAAKTEEGGSVILQKLVDDGSKWVNAMSPFTATGHSQQPNLAVFIELLLNELLASTSLSAHRKDINSLIGSHQRPLIVMV